MLGRNRARLGLDNAPTGNDALGAHRRRPVADQVGQHIHREAVCDHDRLGHAGGIAGEQFERAAAVRVRAAPVCPTGHAYISACRSFQGTAPEDRT
jgi:hypothetical protein